MTDQELKTLFDTIKDFSCFYTKVTNRQDLFLAGGFSIVFHDDIQPATVEITVNGQKSTMDNLIFEKIFGEIVAENNAIQREETLRKEKEAKTKRRDEIFRMEKHSFKVHRAYIDHMLIASQDNVTAHGLYLKKLHDLMTTLNGENILFIDERKVTSGNELKAYLKSVGFLFIDQDTD